MQSRYENAHIITYILPFFFHFFSTRRSVHWFNQSCSVIIQAHHYHILSSSGFPLRLTLNVFKTRLLMNGFHTLINVGSYNPPPLGPASLLAHCLVAHRLVFGSDTICIGPSPPLADIVLFGLTNVESYTPDGRFNLNKWTKLKLSSNHKNYRIHVQSIELKAREHRFV